MPHGHTATLLVALALGPGPKPQMASLLACRGLAAVEPGCRAGSGWRARRPYPSPCHLFTLAAPPVFPHTGPVCAAQLPGHADQPRHRPRHPLPAGQRRPAGQLGRPAAAVRAGPHPQGAGAAEQPGSGRREWGRRGWRGEGCEVGRRAAKEVGAGESRQEAGKEEGEVYYFWLRTGTCWRMDGVRRRGNR